MSGAPATAFDPEAALRLDSQLCFPLYAAARKVTGLYAPLLKPLNLTYTQYIVMLVLWERDGVSVGEICEKLYLDSGTITPLLKKLEAAGYIHRQRSKADERSVLIELTEAGRALKERARQVPERVGSCLPLSPEQALELYSLLYTILRN